MTREERKVEIIRRRLAGEGPRHISTTLGVSPGLVSGVLFRAGMTVTPVPKPLGERKPQRARKSIRPDGAIRQRYSQETRDQARTMYSSGIGPVKISEALGGVSVMAIHSWCRGLNLHKPRTPNDVRAKVIIMHLAGYKPSRIAHLLGLKSGVWVSQFINNTRRIRPNDFTTYKAAGDTLRAEIEATKQAKIERKAKFKANVRAKNAALIFTIQNERHREMCRRVFVDGNNMEEVGRQMGITRERVRQVVTLYIHTIGLDSGGKIRGKPGRIPTGKKRGRPAKPRPSNSSFSDPRAIPTVWGTV